MILNDMFEFMKKIIQNGIDNNLSEEVVKKGLTDFVKLLESQDRVSSDIKEFLSYIIDNTKKLMDGSTTYESLISHFIFNSDSDIKDILSELLDICLLEQKANIDTTEKKTSNTKKVTSSKSTYKSSKTSSNSSNDSIYREYYEATVQRDSCGNAKIQRDRCGNITSYCHSTSNSSRCGSSSSSGSCGSSSGGSSRC